MNLTKEEVRAFLLGVVVQLVLGFFLSTYEIFLEGVFVSAAFAYLGELKKGKKK